MSVDLCRSDPFSRVQPRHRVRVRTALNLAAPILLGGIGGLACDESQPSQMLRTLALSDDISFVCYDADRQEGTRLGQCPDRVDDGVVHELLALVTQTMMGEVAVLNLSSGEVLDVDPATPAPNFLPVGGSPVDIATTPGALASFVAVAEAGSEGIYALPTSCVTTPDEGEPRRDITLWPACSLPDTPGAIEVIVEPPDAQGTVSASCAGDPQQEPASAARACPADLRKESAVSPMGRRLLAVTFPESAALAILDAQQILDRPPGSFDPCPVERWVKLEAQRPAGGVRQPMPPDLVSPTCPDAAVVSYPVRQEQAVPKPFEMTADGGRLYISDRAAPVIHIVDVRDPCSPTEEPPLLPVSFEWPEETVTTRDVAVSPETTSGEKFLYAIDERDGSVMAFDLTPGAPRTPLVRPNAQRLPFQPADRMVFGSPARDLEFVRRDMPLADPETGVALLEQHCDPLPDARPPGSLYRTSGDYSQGARPGKLRGVFATVALANGRIAIVDVEDLDAPCRRPSHVNTSSDADSRGCLADPDIGVFETGDATKTVSDEASCNVVVPHQARSAYFVLTRSSYGVHAPTLRAFPLLTSPEGDLPSGDSQQEKSPPKMLAVPSSQDTDSEGLGTEVFIGTTLYSTTDSAENTLVVDPEDAEHSSLILPMQQPRTYAPTEKFGATYEGALFTQRPSGRLLSDKPWFVDLDIGFCGAGVQDERLATEWAEELGVAEADYEKFSRVYADFVQITADFDDEEPYWTTPAGQACGDGGGLETCEATFGTADEPEWPRELRVIEAHQDHLVVVPQDPPGSEGTRLSAAQRAERLELVRCCFPSLVSYKLRARRQWIVAGSSSGFMHRVTTGPEGRCVRDCSARKALFRGRALEISSTKECSTSETPCGIGPSTPGEDLVCTVDQTSKGVSVGTDEVAGGCVFSGLHALFAIYRGTLPSERDMKFSWEVTGGFVPLTMDMATTGSSVLPQTLKYIDRTDTLVAVDSVAAGVGLFDMSALQIRGRPFL